MDLNYRAFFNAMHRRRYQNGQALVEWIVLGSAILIFWSAAVVVANRLLLRTAVEQWSLIAARQALSNAHTIRISGLRVKKNTSADAGLARVNLMKDSPWEPNSKNLDVRSNIALPKIGAVRSWLDYSPFGSLSSPFLE